MPRGRNKLVYNSSPGGVRGDLNPATIPDGHWVSSRNVIVRRGRVQPRPGYALSTTLSAGDAVIGVLNDGTHLPQGNIAAIHTKTKAYAPDYTTDITGTWTASEIYYPVRMARFSSGGTSYVLRINALNAIDKWDRNLANDFVDATGAPSGADLTVVGPYVVACRDVSQSVVYCAANDVDSWPASNEIKLPEAVAESFVPTAVRALNNQAFVVYTQGTLHLCQLQAAKAAFSSQFIGYYPGPIHASALVAYRGAHYWLSWDYNVWMFDGTRPRIVARPASPLYGAGDIRTAPSFTVPAHAAMIGAERPEFWVILGDPLNARCDMLSYDIESGGLFYHRPAHVFTLIMQYLGDYNLGGHGLQQTILVGASDGKVYTLSDAYRDDNGTAIPWNFEFGYRPLTDVEDRGKLDGIASYFKKTSSSCTVTVSVTLSDGIDDSETATTDTFDTNTAGNHLKTFRSLDPKKWIKLKYSGAQVVADLEYRGSIVTAWERSMI